MWRRALAAVLVALVITSVASRAEEQDNPPPESKAEYYDLLKLFVETFNEVERNYVETISRRELMEAAIEGMLSKLDQHSDYIAPGEMDEFRRSVESEFGGIGIKVSHENGEPTVVTPIVGSPAYRAGLLAGDIITQIDGKPTKGLSLDEAVARMKGKLGSEVKLTIRRADETTKELTVRREKIRIKTVRGDSRQEDDSWDYMYDDDRKIGYVRITMFARYTVRELRKTLDELTEAGLKGLILDLRSNPGGLLSSAIEVSDMFVDSGIIVSVTGRNIETRQWKAHSAGTYPGFPMIVMVNRFSASASEIVAGCLQDHERAVLVGQRTWGKGSVQNILELESGRSALKLTTAEYRRPNGKNIHRHEGASDDDDWGIKPNEGLEIELTVGEARELDGIRRIRDLLPAPKLNDETVEDKQLDLAVKHINELVTESEKEQATEDKSPDARLNASDE